MEKIIDVLVQTVATVVTLDESSDDTEVSDENEEDTTMKHALEYINEGEPRGLDAYIKKNENARKESTEFTQPGPTQRIAKKEHWIDRPLPSENCKTLVLLAIEKNQLECLKVLLNSGANPNLYLNDLHVTPLIFATQKKNLEIMKYLISNQAVDVNFQTEESMSPLHEACAVKGGFTEGVKYLLSLESVLNESLNAVESELKGETPLSCAIEAGNIESVRLLIANDACINHMQANGKTLLLKAIDHGQLDSIRELVKAGADPNGYSKEDWYGTPLTFALYQNKHDCMEVLLELGADPNFTDEKEMKVSALIVATKSDDLDAIKLLLKKGADIRMKDSNGLTVLQIAVKEHAQQATINYLKQVYREKGIKSVSVVGRNPFDLFLKENVVPYNSDQNGRAKEYIEIENLNIFCGSWNINGTDVSKTTGLQPWLAKEDSPPPDIYAVAYQELVDLNTANVVFDSSGENKQQEWIQHTFHSLHPKAKYKIVNWSRLSGMLLIVCIKECYMNDIKNVAIQTVGTGSLGLGNKGGVAVRLEYHRTSICFVCSHLAAHSDKTERRNQDYQDICKRLEFNQLERPTKINDHDMVYWMGDLNYRIEGLSAAKVKDYLLRGKMDELLLVDQLRLEKNKGNVFTGYQEGKIKFKPTYKYDPGTDTWDTSEKSRAPAWCDRILFRGENIKEKYYRSHMEFKNSDHKPISAAFEVGVKIVKTWEGKMEDELSDLKEKVNEMTQLLNAINSKMDKFL